MRIWKYLSQALFMLGSAVYAQESDYGKTEGSVRSPFSILRFEENYRFLADSAQRKEPFDRIKYIPLGRNADYYLSLGGETRQLYERVTYRYREDRTPDGYLLSRFITHADLHLGPKVRLFGQLASGLEWGRMGGPRPVDEDQLYVQNAFVELSLSVSTQPVRMRLGRQEVFLGSGRLLVPREGTNVRNAFDGVRTSYTSGKLRLDALALTLSENRREVFDNPFLDFGTALWGAYASWQAKRVLAGNVDVYYLGLRRENARFHQQQGEGQELRHSFGLRVWGGKGNWDYDLEAIGQFGRFAAGTITAFQYAFNGGYTFAGRKWLPRLGLKTEIISGDRNRTDPDLQTFNPYFPNLGYYRGAAALLPANLIDFHPSISLRRGSKFSIELDWNVYWRQSRQDGLYSPGGLIVPPENSRAQYLGHQPDLNLTYRLSRYVSFTLIYSHFFAGEFVRANPSPREMGEFLNAYLSLKF